MRLDYAQFLELEMFSRFGGVPDARVKAQLAAGQLLRALLSQPQYAPLRLVDEVALAAALRDGLLDAVAPDKIAARSALALPAWLDQHAGPVVQDSKPQGTMDRQQRDVLSLALRSLAQTLRDGGPGAVTERLAETTRRIENLHQLEAVVTAMRGIAASRAQQARGLLPGLRAYASVVAPTRSARASRWCRTDHRRGGSKSGRTAVILFCAEQGFAGAFSDRMLEATRTGGQARDIFLIGTRGAMLAGERRITLAWHAAMVPHASLFQLWPDGSRTRFTAGCPTRAGHRSMSSCPPGRPGAGWSPSAVRCCRSTSVALPFQVSGQPPLITLATFNAAGAAGGRICLRRTLRGRADRLCRGE